MQVRHGGAQQAEPPHIHRQASCLSCASSLPQPNLTQLYPRVPSAFDVFPRSATTLGSLDPPLMLRLALCSHTFSGLCVCLSQLHSMPCFSFLGMYRHSAWQQTCNALRKVKISKITVGLNKEVKSQKLYLQKRKRIFLMGIVCKEPFREKLGEREGSVLQSFGRGEK